MALLPLWSGVDLLGRHGGSRWSLPDDLHEWPTILQSGAANQLRDLRTQLTHLDRSSSLTIDKEHFQANIDVQQFRPDEISVRLLDDHSVKVEAKHEEQQDDHGFISRHFVRRYLLPKDCDPTKLKSKLSADGILVITAPKKQEDDAIEGQEIPISHVRPFISRPHLWPSHYGDRKRKLSSSN
ncbi:alpha-crystallin A chain isoform X2 [Dendroctonus ponderosae]|nr:alpha-crystallin A chain isoform X2 [Dendroctonus ponderosae]